MKYKFPLIDRPVHTPTFMNLRITDGGQGRAEAPKARGYAYQLTAEEAMMTPNVVIGMYLYMLMLALILNCMLMFMICLGTFLVNSLRAIMLIDSGVSKFFISLSFNRIFDIAL